MSESNYDFDRVIDRRQTASEKWDKYQGRDILPLWVADMDFCSPPAVVEALQERVKHGIFGYTHAPRELAPVLISYLQEEFDWRIETDWLIWLPGLVTGLNIACRIAGEIGDEIVTFTPIYPPFLHAPPRFHRPLITVPLQWDSQKWIIDWSVLQSALTPRTRMILFCSPHNPVGRVWDRHELQELAEFALRHHLILCSDEIHAGLVLDKDKRHIPLASLSSEIARHTITLQAPSKTFNIPGLGCSFAVISEPGLRKQFKRAMAGIVPHVNLFGFTATLAAYLHGKDWHHALLGYLRGNRDFLISEMQNLSGLRIFPVEATYLAWIDARDSGMEAPVQFFEQHGVGLSDGADFGAKGFLRLNFGCPQAILAQALQRMKNASSR